MKNTPFFLFFGFLTITSIAFIYLISPFFIAIFMAFVIARFFRRPYNFFKKKIGQTLGALITTLIVVISVVLPLITMFTLVSFEAQKNYTTVQNKIINSINQIGNELQENKLIAQLKNNEFTKNLTEETFTEENIQSLQSEFIESVKNSTQWLFNQIKDVFLDLTKISINFLLMVYLLYFLLQKGKLFTNYLQSFIPFPEEEKKEFIQEAFRVIDATIIGTIFIGILEGLFGGILFHFFNVPSPVTWGLIMCVLSMFPVVGTNAILLPFGIFQLSTGNYFTGLIVLIIGCGGVLLNQNIIKPKLVGNRSGVHPAILILSSLGGISFLGIIGFIVGPTIATLCIVLWKQFKAKFSNFEIKN